MQGRGDMKAADGDAVGHAYSAPASGGSANGIAEQHTRIFQNRAATQYR
jgi:hypothetical protein